MAAIQRLDEFRREINRELACGALAEMDLPVTDADGGRPVVVALEAEKLSVVLGRLRAVGGSANLFVSGENSIRVASVIDSACSIADPSDDMTSADDQPDPGATVGMFLDHVERHPHGVAIPAALGHPACARDAQRVEFARK